MKKGLVYKIIFIFLTAFIHEIGYGNTNTRQYCKNLIDSAKKECLARNYVKSMGILTEVQPIIKENKFVELEIQRLNIIGVIHSYLLAYDKAMEYYTDAYDIAVKSHNLKSQSTILNNISIVYRDNNEADKCFDYLKKAYDISVKLGDNKGIGEIANNIVYVAIYKKDTALGEQYINIARNVQTDNKELFIKTQIVTIEFLLFKKDYVAAESMVLHLLQEEEKIEMEPKHKISLFFFLAEISQNKKNYEKAVYYLNEILKEKVTLREKIKAYERLSELYQESNSFTLALQYKDSVLQTSDSLHKINNKQYMEMSHVRMALLNSEKELAESKAKQKVEHILIISITAFICLLAIILICLFRIQSIRNKQRKQITELELEKEKNQKLLLEQQFKEHETLALLEQEKLNNEIETKNRQLTARILSQSNKNKLVEEILEILPKSGNKIGAKTLSLTRRRLKMELKESTELDAFLVHFEQTNPKLFSFLKEYHPDLTTGEIRLLSYIYLDLNAKEIASLLNITHDYCKKKKQRLAHKMRVQTGQLHDYLISIA